MPQKTGGVIAAGHQKTAEAGIEILRSGGNAFDAAVAAILASFVAEPGFTSAAGGGFLLAHTHSNRNILFDFFSQTPRQKRNPQDINFYPVEVNFGTVVQEFHIGLGSMAVPGNIAGIFHIHKKLGKLPLAVIAEPAIHYARNGIKLNPFQYHCLTDILAPIVTANKEGKSVFIFNNEPLEENGLLRMPEFADTLTYLIKAGERAFYEGDIALQLVKDCQELGGHLTLEDLRQYRVIEREPLPIDYRGNTLLTNPPPSSGGILIAFALKLLSSLDVASIGFGTTRHLEILAQVMQLTNESRKNGYDKRLYHGNIAEEFLASQTFLQSQQALVETTNKWGSTTHISVIDRDGNAASVTTSNGEGSGYVIPGTGIMINNMLGEEDLNPHGFHQWQENRRISSMMAPTLVLQEGQPKIALGSGGSNRIRTAILQVISNILDFQMSAHAAVDSPRVHWERNIFNIEPGFPEAEGEALALPPSDRVLRWQEKSLFFGGVHTVLETADGAIEGAGDRRRDGVVASC